MQPPILFFDGCCPLCNFVVRVIYRLDRRGTLRFAPIASEIGRLAIERHPFLEKLDSAFLIERNWLGEERVSVEAEIPGRVAPYLGWPQKLLLLPFRLLPKSIGTTLYHIIAKYRTAVFGRYKECFRIPAAMRDRILTHE